MFPEAPHLDPGGSTPGTPSPPAGRFLSLGGPDHGCLTHLSAMRWKEPGPFQLIQQCCGAPPLLQVDPGEEGQVGVPKVPGAVGGGGKL